MRSYMMPVSLALFVLAALFAPICTSGQEDTDPGIAETSESRASTQTDPDVASPKDRAKQNELSLKVLDVSSQGKTEDAITIGKELLVFETKVFGAGDLETSGTHDLLAKLYLRTDDASLARVHAEKQIEVFAAHTEAKSWRSAYAIVFRDDVNALLLLDKQVRLQMVGFLVSAEKAVAEGQHDKAIEMHRKFLKAAISELGEESYTVAAGRAELARVLNSSQEFKAAETEATLALSTYKKLLGNAHPYLGGATWQIAQARMGLDEAEEAISAVRDTKKYWAIANWTSDIAWVDLRLAGFLVFKERREEASEVYQRAYAVFRELENQDGMSQALRGYADTQSAMGKAAYYVKNYNEAITLLQKAADAYDELGAKVDNAWMYDWMGSAYRDSSRLQEAIAAFNKSLKIFDSMHLNGLGGVNTETGNLGDTYMLLMQFDKAAESFRRQLSVRNRLYGDQHYSVTDSKISAARAEIVKRFDEQQLVKYRELMELRKQKGQQSSLHDNRGEIATATKMLVLIADLFGDKDFLYAINVRRIGELYYDLGDYPKSEARIKESITRFKELVGEDHPEYAYALDALGDLYSDSGREPEARKILAQALEIMSKTIGRNAHEYANTLNAMGYLLMNVDEPENALPYFQEGNAIHVRRLGNLHSDSIMSLNNIGYALQGLARFDEAITVLERVVAFRKATDGENHPHYAMHLSNLAWCYFMVGRFEEADDIYRTTVQRKRSTMGDQHPFLASALSSHADVLVALKNDQEAARLLQESTEITARFLDQTAVLLTDSQQLSLTQSHRFRVDRLLSSLKRLGNKKTAAFETVLNWKGQTLVRQRTIRDVARKPEIAPLFEELQTATRKWAALATAEVEPDQQEAVSAQLQTLRQKKDRLEARLSRKSGEFREFARKLNVEDLHACLPKDSVLVDFFVYAYSDWVPLDAKSVFAEEQNGGIGIYGERTDEGFRVTTVFDDGAAKVDGRLWVDDVIVAVAEDGEDFVEVHSKPLIGPTDSKVRLKVHRKGRTKPFVISLVRKPLKLRLAGGMSFSRSLLAFVVRDGHEVEMFDLGEIEPLSEAADIWLKTHGQSRQGKDAGKKLREAIWEPLLESIEDAKLVLLSPDGFLGRFPIAALPGKKAGSYLLEDHTITMVPVPQLLPVLMKQETGNTTTKDLLLLGGVDYDASPQPIQLDERIAETPQRMKPGDRRRIDAETLIAANRAREGKTWDALDETVNEVEHIRGLWTRLFDASADDFVDLRGAAATESAFRENAPKCEYLHLATHGFFAAPEKLSVEAGATEAGSTEADSNRGNVFGKRREAVKDFSPGLLSGIVFAGANNPPDLSKLTEEQLDQISDDGIMSADEIAFLPLGGVQLVVLSACETGLGEVAGGEGLLGIQRAFQISGARSTVASLWSVDDTATMALMREFYKNYLDKQLSAAESLRQAQLWALKNPGQLFRGDVRRKKESEQQRTSPTFWAAFTISGDWR